MRCLDSRFENNRNERGEFRFNRRNAGLNKYYFVLAFFYLHSEGCKLHFAIFQNYGTSLGSSILWRVQHDEEQ